MDYSQKKEWLSHIDFMIVDIISVMIAMFIALITRHGLFNPYGSEDFNRLTAVTAILFICIIFLTEPYNNIIKRGYLKELKVVVLLNALLVLSLITYLFAVHISDRYSRALIFNFYIINSFLMYSIHCIRKYIVRRRNVKAKHRNYMVLVTKRKYVERCLDKLTENPYAGKKVAGIVFLDGSDERTEIHQVPVLGGREALIPYCKSHVVDDVLFYLVDDKVEDLTNQLTDMGIVIHINVVQKVDERLKYNVGSVNGILTLTACINYATTWELAMKRFIDIVGGLVGVILTGIIAILIAPIVKLQSPGPLFFSQVRVGKNGRKFRIYKFRSMYTDAEERKKELMKYNKVDGLMFKIDNDPRIFPFGHFMRKMSLDEFPQFLNVLKGDMSLVGTRPPTVDEWEQYELHHHRRLSVKPGLTGLWQVSGRSNITDFEKVVELDTKYIMEWSLGLDFRILIKTVFVVLRREGSE